MKRDWLDDDNLLILLPEPLLNEWQGADSDDYDRACKLSNSWLNTIPVQEGLLLGGDSGMVLVTRGKDGSPVLIRWVYAEDENELVEFSLQGNSVIESEPDLVLHNRFAKWWLFDATKNPSSDKPTMKLMDLPLGQMHVETVYCESKKNAAIVHRFRNGA